MIGSFGWETRVVLLFVIALLVALIVILTKYWSLVISFLGPFTYAIAGTLITLLVVWVIRD